jgi:hypothetical protein
MTNRGVSSEVSLYFTTKSTEKGDNAFLLLPPPYFPYLPVLASQAPKKASLGSLFKNPLVDKDYKPEELFSRNWSGPERA